MSNVNSLVLMSVKKIYFWTY